MVTVGSHYGGFLEHRTMTVIYIVLLAHAVFTREISNNIEGPDNYKVTTLYPVNDTNYFNREKDNIGSEQTIKENNNAIKENATDKFDSKERDHRKLLNQLSMKNNLNAKIEDKHFEFEPRNAIVNKTSWKINTTYSSSKLGGSDDDKNAYNNSRIKLENYSEVKAFKPSPHLGNYYDENAFVLPPLSTEETFFHHEKPLSGSGYISSPKDFVQLEYKNPNDFFPPNLNPPYKFENNIPTYDWHYETGLEPRPTVEAPVEVPAGGLYNSPNVFRERPSSDGDNENFGLEFKDEKEVAVKKKRANPWKNLLNLVTALIPVGIIVSALTPSIITLESADNNPHFPHRASRSYDRETSLPPISERCKRRLLCELHSDANYIRNSQHSPPSRPRHCYKLHCEDTEALSEMLYWLLYRNVHQRHQPTIQDRRGYINRK